MIPKDLKGCHRGQFFLAQRLFCLQTWTPQRLDGKHSAMQKLEIPQGLAAELRQGEGCATAGCPPWPESGRRCLCHSTRLVSEGEDQWVEQYFTNGLRCSENQLLAHQWWLAIYICPCLWPSPCREDLVATRACSLACRTSHTALSRAKYQRKWPAWPLLLKSDGFWIQLLPPRGRIEVGQKRHRECKCKLSFCIIWCGTAIVHLGQFQLRHCVFEGPRRWGNGANRLKLQLPGATQLQMGKLEAVVTQDRPGPDHRCFRWTTWKSWIPNNPSGGCLPDYVDATQVPVTPWLIPQHPLLGKNPIGLMGLSKNGGRWTQHNIRRLPKLEQLCQRDHPKVDATRSPRKLTCPNSPNSPN